MVMKKTGLKRINSNDIIKMLEEVIRKTYKLNDWESNLQMLLKTCEVCKDP